MASTSLHHCAATGTETTGTCSSPDSFTMPPRDRVSVSCRASDGRSASDTFDRAARPDHAALVQLEVFEGPLALLLTLIEQRQLDVLTVPLGDLCGAYLEALATLPGSQLPHASAFISVASQLILIKSRAMLPRPQALGRVEEEGADPEAALRERLLMYRRYRDASSRLSERLASGVAT